MEEDNISAAVRLVSSDDAPTLFNQEIFQFFKQKHQSAPANRHNLPDSIGLNVISMEKSLMLNGLYNHSHLALLADGTVCGLSI